MDDHERARADRRAEDMPEHESDEDVETVAGGGVMSTGGTAVDRGTGTTAGTAQGPMADDDEDDLPGDDDDLDPLAPREGQVVLGVPTHPDLDPAR